MDTTTPVTHVGLCAGYGGIELGLRRVIPNLRSVALCEIEAFAVANLVAKMEAGLLDPAPVWPDLKTFPWASFHRRVDILTGGYPCQPFSSAGKRAGTEDPRHLWPWIADGIAVMRPRICFFENVDGHISLGLSTVISDLEELGYSTTWGVFSAAECGAPHQRKRVFILANHIGAGLEGLDGHGVGVDGQGWISQGQGGPVSEGSLQAWPTRPGEQQYGWEPPRVVANSDRVDRSAPAEGREHDRQAGSAGEELGDSEVRQDNGREPGYMEGEAGEWGCVDHATDGAGEESHQRQTQPALGGDPDGYSGGLDYAKLCVSGDNRTDELRLLGNGVVPATAALAFRTLSAQLT